MGILVDLLTSLEYVRVMLKPEVEVYSGKQAEITSKQHVPDPTAEPGVVEMVECEDLVKLTPRADSTGRIALDIAAEICDVVFGDSAGKTPGITKHSIDTKAVLGEDKTLVLRLESTTEAKSQDDSVL